MKTSERPNFAGGRRFNWPALVRMIVLAVPAIAVHAWLAWNFSGFSSYRFLQGVLFSACICALLVCLVRWRFLGRFSWIAASPFYVLWIVLVLAEAVSYALQDDTFNDRFFAHLDPGNLATGLHGFPWLIGGGLAVLAGVSVFTVWILSKVPQSGASVKRRAFAAAALVLVLLPLDSTPSRLAAYFIQYQRSFAFADTPEGQRVYREINPNPVSRHLVLASPGRNLVWIYMESLERIYTDPKVFPGLTPNLDRLMEHSLDFPGFETFHGAGYTMAGIFASQCGAPFFSSPFAALDGISGNNTDKTNFQGHVACFGDVLHRAGYKQIFLGGAPISFSNKGLFFHIHGYDEALGKAELETRHGHNLPASGWGLYDRDLFRIATERYRDLAASGHPFNLTLLTLDTHPPHARPSPGCPRYAASDNPVLQGVHCTDYLVGKFIDEISANPAWKNTTVVIMSDHLRMVTEGAVPLGHHRHPLLFVLNAGATGERDARIYHMDIAPTILHLLGVSTNASFIAGEDRSAPGALDNPLVMGDVADAVLRKALWQRAGRFRLCKHDTLLTSLPVGNFEVGGRKFEMAKLGERQVALTSGEALMFVTTTSNATPVLVKRDQLKHLDKWRGKASILTIEPVPGKPDTGLFSIDWVGRNGAVAHLADTDLQGFRLHSAHCSALLREADDAPSGSKLDFRRQFVASNDALPVLAGSGDIDFTSADAYAYESLIGWHPATSWGSYTEGDLAEFGFRLPASRCEGESVLSMTVRPYLVPSRPALDVDVLVNGKPATTWHFRGDGNTPRVMNLPVIPDAVCRAVVRLVYKRPGAQPAPYPKGEDPRDLQLVVYDARLGTAPANEAPQVTTRP